MLDQCSNNELVILDAVALILGERAELVAHSNGCDSFGPSRGFLWDLKEKQFTYFENINFLTSH